MMLLAKLSGVDAALQKYEEAKSLGDPKKTPDEYVLNSVGNYFHGTARWYGRELEGVGGYGKESDDRQYAGA